MQPVRQGGLSGDTPHAQLPAYAENITLPADGTPDSGRSKRS